MGAFIIGMADFYFFNVRTKERILLTVPWHKNWRKFKRSAWRALELEMACEINSLKKDFIIEKQKTLNQK